jgi:phytoene dehydrogenase-like protein/NAD-dependent dihydropyrimidine dehydrogenase PreA subunit
MQLLKERCTGCGYCVLVCPYDALKSDGWAEVIPENCTDCNLCLYACPTDCFVPEPEFPPKVYRPRLASYEVTIIGSGLGGLMAGAALAQAGRKVAVFEKLGFPGGRYTELDYKGAAVTTGAWTNLGPDSHIGRFLSELGLDLSYISLEAAGLAEQYSLRFPDGRHYNSLFELLQPQARRGWLKAVLQGKQLLEQKKEGITRPEVVALDEVSAADYIAEFCDDPDLLAAVEAIAATASGLSSTLMPASEYLQITLDGREIGRHFAMPVGGVRAIIKALTRSLRQAGGELFLRSPVAKILVENGTAVGLALEDGRQVRSRLVIHNGGPGRFVEVVGSQNLPADYLRRLSTLKGVECAALFCATREPLFTEAPITMTPGCRRVVGIFSPTRLDPGLSKSGLHLADAFFPIHSPDRRAELALALADMRDLFPRFDELVEWFVPMFFTGNWAGTESGQTFGQTGENRLDPVTPIQNCLLVGMDIKGSGVAGDLIPLGVRRALSGAPAWVSASTSL